MTTLADRIADFETQANQLLDLPQQIADTAQARINQLGSYWDQHVNNMHTYMHVHQQNGDDAAAGTAQAPLKSIDEALRRTPPGGVCDCILHSGYHFSEPLPVSQTFLAMSSAGTIRYPVTVERLTREWEGVQKRYSAGIELRYRGAVMMMGLTVTVPPLDGNWGTLDPIPYLQGFIQTGQANRLGGQLASLVYCDIAIPAAPFCAVVGNDVTRRPIELYVQSCVATDQPLEGNLLSSATDTNGTATSGLPWLQTNLVTV